jgi:hypothetical protein
LEDILAAMSQRDAIEDSMPKFVSENMSNIPWSTDGNATNAQILASIHDMKRDLVTKDTLNSAISQLRSEFVGHSHSIESPELSNPPAPQGTLVKTVSPLIGSKSDKQKKAQVTPPSPSIPLRGEPKCVPTFEPKTRKHYKFLT